MAMFNINVTRLIALVKSTLGLAVALLLCACGNTLLTESSSSESSSGVEVRDLLVEKPVGAVKVEGTKVRFGDKASIAGTSLFWSNDGWGGERYYNADVVAWLKQDWNTGLVRASMGVEAEGGYIKSPASNKHKIKTVVEAAISHGLYVIIDWHSHHAEDHPSEAVDFFDKMARRYGGYNHVIYEIYNEPLNNVSWTDTIKPYAEAVIAAIRRHDPDNLIVVGTPQWSQLVEDAADDPITSTTNIAYALHFYAGTHGQDLRDEAIRAMNKGAALFVTEWGMVNASGDGDIALEETERWIQFFRDHNLSHVNWAVNDKVEGTSALKPGASVEGGWADDELTESGVYIKDLVSNW